MAGIPRFQAQIKTVSIPRMQDYEYEQNRSIYQTLKAAGERIDNTFFEMVAEGQLGQPSTYQPNKAIQQDRAYFDREMEARKISNIDNPNLLR